MAASPELVRIGDCWDDSISDRAFEALPLAVLVADLRRENFPLVMVNAAACRCLSTGPDVGAVLGAPLERFVPSKTIKDLKKALNAVRSARQPCARELAWRTRRGEIALLTEFTPLRPASDRCLVMISFAPDAQPAPRARALDALPANLLILDRSLKITYVNAAAAGACRASAAKLLGRSALAVAPTAAIHIDVFRGALAGRPFHHQGIPLLTPGEPPRWFEVFVQPILGARDDSPSGSQVIALTVMSMEVTDRCLESRAQQASARRLRALTARARDVIAVQSESLQRDEVFKIAAEAVNGIIFEWDLVAGQITRTRGVREVTGLDPAALRPEPEAWFERMHPGDAKVARAQMAAGLESCSGWTTRYRFRDAAGAYRAMLERSVVKCDAGGTAVRAVGCVVDVSEFDRLTSLLADTERAAQIGGWEYFYRSGSMRWTQEMYRIFDTTPAEFTVTPKAAMDRLAGVSRRALRTAFSAAEAGRGQFDVAVELVSFTEQHRWVRVVGHIERLDGVPFRIHGSLQDITAQRKAQAALESRTDWLALSMRMAHMHAWRWDRGRDVFEFAALDGRVRPLPRVIVNMPELLARVHPEDRASAVQAIERAFASGSQIQGELRIRSASRRYRAYAMVARPVFDAAGEPVGLAGVTRDVTLRHEAESRLRRSEELLRVTTENSADMLMLLDRNLRIRFVNKAPRGTTSEEMIGERLDVFLPLKSRKSVLQRLKRLLTNGLTVTFEYDVPDEFGQPQYFENRAELVREAGIGTGVSVAVRDITQRKRLEREILEVSSRERHSIGRDLHDGLGQELTGVALMLRGLATRLEGRAPEMVDQVNEIVGVVNQSIESVRSLVRGLLPVSLHRGGLAHALRTLATRSRTLYGLDVAFHADVWPQLPLDETGASHLYRIAQEALTNAARHGQATAVDIYLRSTPTTLLLQVADNGCGIAPDAPEPKGMGLKIMEYRAGMIGAKLEIVPNEPQGTIVRIIGQNGHVGLSV